MVHQTQIQDTLVGPSTAVIHYALALALASIHDQSRPLLHCHGIGTHLKLTEDQIRVERVSSQSNESALAHSKLAQI